MKWLQSQIRIICLLFICVTNTAKLYKRRITFKEISEIYNYIKEKETDE